MVNFDVVAFTAPAGGEEIRDETAVAFFGARFGAEQRNLGRPARCVEHSRNAAIFHQGEEAGFVSWPVPGFAIGLEEFGRGGEKRFRNVCDPRNLLEEIGEVGVLGVTGKLPAAILANVNEPLDSRFFQEGKKFFRCFSRESDGAEKIWHGDQKYSMASGEARKANSSV